MKAGVLGIMASSHTVVGGGGGPTPPTFVSDTQTASFFTIGTGNPATKTLAAISVQAGDVLVVYFGQEWTRTNTYAVSSTVVGGSAPTWTKVQEVAGVGDYCGVFLAVATVGAGTTSITITITETAGGAGMLRWGFGCMVFRGSSGVGGSAKTNASGMPSLSITTQGASGSTIVTMNGDWAATPGAPNWRTFDSAGTNQRLAVIDGSAAAYHCAYQSPTASSGAKTVGMTQPTGQTYSICAVEIKGT